MLVKGTKKKGTNAARRTAAAVAAAGGSPAKRRVLTKKKGSAVKQMNTRPLAVAAALKEIKARRAAALQAIKVHRRWTVEAASYLFTDRGIGAACNHTPAILFPGFKHTNKTTIKMHVNASFYSTLV